MTGLRTTDLEQGEIATVTELHYRKLLLYTEEKFQGGLLQISRKAQQDPCKNKLSFLYLDLYLYKGLKSMFSLNYKHKNQHKGHNLHLV